MPTIGDGARQSGKDLAKNRVGQVGCDPLFVISRFLEGSLMKGPAIARCRQEGGTREDEGKDLQSVSALLLAESEQAAIMAGDGQDHGQIDLEKLF